MKKKREKFLNVHRCVYLYKEEAGRIHQDTMKLPSTQVPGEGRGSRPWEGVAMGGSGLGGVA